MESWGGAFKNAVSSWWDPESVPGGGSEGAAKSDGAGDTSAKKAEGTGQQPGARAGAPAAPAAGAGSAAMAAPRTSAGASSSDAMGQLSSLVSGLKVQAEQMNATIAAQSTALETALDSADKNTANMQAASKRTQAMTKGWFS